MILLFVQRIAPQRKVICPDLARKSLCTTTHLPLCVNLGRALVLQETCLWFPGGICLPSELAQMVLGKLSKEPQHCKAERRTALKKAALEAVATLGLEERRGFEGSAPVVPTFQKLIWF